MANQTDIERQKHDAICYPLSKIARELDACSPELRRLLHMALVGANGAEPGFCSPIETLMACQRLHEANRTRTAEAKAERAQACADAFTKTSPNPSAL